MDEPIVRKMHSRASAAEAGMSLQPVQSREVRLQTTAQSLERMRKRAEVTVEHPVGSTFEILCDEGAYLEGDDSAPPPLGYFAASIAFCLLTQLSRYAKVKKLDVRNLRVQQTLRFTMEGSILAGTLRASPLKLETQVFVDSEEPAEAIQKMVEVGENSCFIMQSLLRPMPTETTVTVNGEVCP